MFKINQHFYFELCVLMKLSIFLWKIKKIKINNNSGPHLSDPTLRQRPFPSPGAILDVAGGGEGEESQDAQGEQGLMHGCWF